MGEKVDAQNSFCDSDVQAPCADLTATVPDSKILLQNSAVLQY